MASQTRYKKQRLKSTDCIYVCSICQKIQTSAAQIQRHLATHTSFQCDCCPKIFQTHQQLENHLVTHQESANIPCSVCQKTFAHARYLYQHMLTHSSEKRFVCEVCGKCFTQQVHLDNHLGTHQNWKPFTCKQCKKEFSCEGSLTRHSKTHNKSSLLSCSHCDKTFTRNSTLLLHIQVIHENKLAHKCAKCNRAFSQKAYLKAHHEKMHSESPPPVPEILTNAISKLNFSISILKPVSIHMEVNDLLETPHKPSEATLNNITKETSDEINDVPSATPLNAPSTFSDKELNDILDNGEKINHFPLPLFSETDVSELLNPSEANLEEDCFLTSFEDWECPLTDEALPMCSMDQESESSQDFNSKEFLNSVSDEYLNSLQCTISF